MKDPPTPGAPPRAFPLANKLVLCFALLSTILAAIAAVSLFGLRTIGELNGSGRATTLEATELPRRVSKNLSAQQAEIFRHLSATDSRERAAHEKVIARLAQLNAEDLIRYHEGLANQNEERLYREVLEAKKRFSEQTQKLLSLSGPKGAEAIAFAVARQVPLFDRYQGALDALIQIEEEEGHENVAATNREIEASRNLCELLIGLAILVILGTGVAGLQVIRGLRKDKGTLLTEMEERAAAEVALRESEARYRLLVDHSPDAVFVVCEKKIVFVNPATLKLLGAATPGQLVGKSIYEIVPAEEHAEVERRAAEVAVGKPAPATERRLLRLDGSPVEVESTVISFLFAGQPAMQVTARDNSERKIAAAELRAQEKQFRLLFEDNPSPMWVFEIETLGILAVNQAAIASYGYTRAEFLRLTLRNLRPAEDVPALVAAVTSESASSSYAGEWRHLKKDGTAITAAVYSSPTVFEGKAARVTLAIDRTEQAEAERRMRESEANLVLAQQVAGVGSWEYQFAPEGWINQAKLTWSQEAYRLFGLYPEVPISTETFFHALHPDDRAHFASLFAAFLEGDTPFKIDFRIVRPDGTERTVYAVAEKTFDERTGKLFKVVGTLLDMTERREVEEQLRAADDKYRTIFDHALEGIFQNTPEGQVLSANPALARMLGFDSPEQLIAERNGIGQQAYTDPAERVAFQRALEEEGFINNFEFQMKRRDGSTIWVSENSRIVRDGSGKALYYEGTMQDITERKRASTMLVESEQRLALAREAAHIGIWDWNVVTNELVWDERMYEIYGIRARDFSGAYNAWQKGLHPDDRARAEVEIMAAVKEARGFHSEFRVLWPDGQVREIEAHAEVVCGPDGGTTRMIGVNWDITERKRAEEQLFASGQMLRSVLDTIPHRVFWKDRDCVYLGGNRPFALDAGFAGPEELVGKNDDDAGWREHAESYRADDRAVMETGVAKVDFEEPLITADGRPIWLRTSKIPLRDREGKVYGVLGMYEDITARRQTEEAQARFAAIMAATPDFVGVADGTGRVLYMNSAGRKMVGFTDDEDVTQTTIAEHTAPSECHRLMEECVPAAMRDGVWSGEMTFVDRAGREIPLSQVIVTHKTPSGEVDFIATTAQDLTERKKADAALEKANRQLLEASRQAGMAEVATSVLHNVGNVLNSVNVSCSVISDKVRGSRISGVARTAEALQAHTGDLAVFFREDPVGRKLPDFLAKLALRLAGEQSEIIGELQLLSQNIQHIKDIVAVQQNHAKDHGGVRETLPLQGLMEDALRMNAAALLRHRIEVVREYGEAPSFPLEKHKVVQILVNLVRNAKHALNDGGRDDKRLVVRIARHNGSVAVSVSDNGVGIAPENKIRIFSHGFTTKKDGHGFGLHSGVLAAQEMGGSLVAQSDGPGQGATFTLELPVNGHGKN